MTTTELVENEDDGIAAASDSNGAGEENEVEEDGDGDIMHLHEPWRTVRSRRVSVYADLTYVPGVKIRLFSPPRQRQKWGSDQILPHVNWGDLFFDLFYVAGFYNLGNILVHDPSPLGVLYFMSCFFSILHIWTLKMTYDSLFTYGDDIYHRIFETVVLVILATAVSNIATVPRMSSPNDYVDMFEFSLSLTLLNLLHCGRYIECYYFGRGQRKNIAHTVKNHIMAQIIPLTLYVAATIVAGMSYFGNDYDDDKRRGLAGGSSETVDCDGSNKMHIPIMLVMIAFIFSQLWTIVMVVVFYQKHGEHKKNTIPMNIGFVIHRQGELTMLVLGESVLSLLMTVDGESGHYLTIFYAGIITVVVLQLLHFRSQPHDANTHALRRHKNAGILFYQAFAFYSVALIAVGASYKLFLYAIADDRRRLLPYFPAVDEDSNRLLAGGGGDSGCGPSGEEREQLVAHLFSGAMTIVFVCLDVMILAHVGLKKNVDKCKVSGVVCERTGATKIHYNFNGMIFAVLPRGVITIFVATLSQWQKNPRTLALLGLAAVVCQLFTRFLGDVLLPNDDRHGHGHNHHGGIDDDDDSIDDEDEQIPKEEEA